MPGLGRIPFMHPKSFQYNVAPLLAEMPKKYRSHPWPDWQVEVDQGNSGTCTAAALLKMIAGLPVTHDVAGLLSLTKADEPLAPDDVRALIMALYRRNVMNDVWADNNFEADHEQAPRLEDLTYGSS